MKNTITIEDLESRIKKEEFVVVGKKTTICCLTLKNGFEVTGESACVDTANFNKEIGEKYARERAVEKIWQLEDIGYNVKGWK